MRTIGFIALLFVASVTNADVIHIPVGQQAPERQDLPRPVRGMSATQVLEQFGLPLSKTQPVGEPPISSWRYPEYTVYFESDTVIHSVLQHTPRIDVESLKATPTQ